MTAPAPTARGYALRLRREGARVRAQVDRTGPGDVGRIGVGRTPAAAADLAALVFPICPRAHALALTRACERALGEAPAANVAAARQAAAYAEALAGAVWRMTLDWPALRGEAPQVDTLKAARTASQELFAALFDGPWLAASDDALANRPQEARAAARTLTSLARGVLAEAAPPSGPSATPPDPALRPLGDRIWRADLDPADGVYEETPRALQGADAGGFFPAQSAHAARLADALDRLMEGGSDAREPEPTAAASGAGTGVGVAITARGRLRHVASVRDGVLTAWAIAAPTDWNFAPDGPVARVAAGLSPQADLAAAGRLVVAAYDPCAPCEVVVGGADA